ncbi:Hypothetical protein A7982_06337 [Minicystis rosea]|nr:Hypothetical protein A7982_06337 [Minicystis rosea]
MNVARILRARLITFVVEAYRARGARRRFNVWARQASWQA